MPATLSNGRPAAGYLAGLRVGVAAGPDLERDLRRELCCRGASGVHLRPASQSLAAIRRARVSAVVLDPAAVDSMWELLEEISLRAPALAVVVHSRRTDLTTRLRGLRVGADDWVTGPVDAAELGARIEAACRPRILLRRPGSAEVVWAGGLELDVEAGLASAEGRRLELSDREFTMLLYLAHERERVLTRERIYEHVWGLTPIPGNRTVDTYVHRLRAALGRSSPSWAYIQTHFHSGYCFAPRRRGREGCPPGTPHCSAGSRTRGR